MGLSIKNLFQILCFARECSIPRRATIVELGAQQLYIGDEVEAASIRNFFSEIATINEVGHADWPTPRNEDQASHSFERCGCRYAALDISPGPNVTVFDLNTDSAPPELAGQCDLVTNFGTTEHVLNQLNCFEVIHDLVRPGGLIYHDLPMGGYFFHGYFTYTPMFFIHLAVANDYEVLLRRYGKASGPARPSDPGAPAEMIGNGWPDTNYQDMSIEFIFRKTTAEAFRVPVDVATGSDLSQQSRSTADPRFRRLATRTLT